MGVQTDEDAPPPVPERTPESYELSVNAGVCLSVAALLIILYPLMESHMALI